MEHEVEYGRPLPLHRFRHQRAKYPFAKMAVGDWFKVNFSYGNSVKSSAAQYRNRHGKRFMVRMVWPFYVCHRVE